MRLEKTINQEMQEAGKIVERARKEAIGFYEKNLSREALGECQRFKGTEYYARVLVQKYIETRGSPMLGQTRGGILR